MRKATLRKLTKAAGNFMSGKLDMSKINQGMFKNSTINSPTAISDLLQRKAIADEMNKAGVRNSMGMRSKKYYKN